jgi:hypothetical protein
MVIRIWITAIVLVLGTLAQATTTIKTIETVPTEMYQRELTPIRVRVTFNEPGPHKVSLLQIDRKGGKPRLIGIMTDEGVAGDQFTGDGVYTRKFKLVHHFAEDVKLAVRRDDTDELIEPMAIVKVKYRPSFVEMLKNAWENAFE